MDGCDKSNSYDSIHAGFVYLRRVAHKRYNELSRDFGKRLLQLRAQLLPTHIFYSCHDDYERRMEDNDGSGSWILSRQRRLKFVAKKEQYGSWADATSGNPSRAESIYNLSFGAKSKQHEMRGHNTYPTIDVDPLEGCGRHYGAVAQPGITGDALAAALRMSIQEMDGSGAGGQIYIPNFDFLGSDFNKSSALRMLDEESKKMQDQLEWSVVRIY